MNKVIFILIALLLGFFTYRRNDIWRNEYTLWKDAVAKSPKRIVPHLSLGDAFIRRNALAYAEREFLLALKINKFDLRVHNGLGVIYFQKGLLDKALYELRLIAIGKPEYPYGHYNLGIVYMAKGLTDEAIKEFNTTLELDSNFPDAYINLGLAYIKKDMLKEAKEEFEKVLQISPEHRDAKRHLNTTMKLLQERETVR